MELGGDWDHGSGIKGNPQGISQGINRCLLIMAVQLTKPGITEGCAAGEMWSCGGVEGLRWL
jgi:hypothetical protein